MLRASSKRLQLSWQVFRRFQSSNPQLSFPCVDQAQERSRQFEQSLQKQQACPNSVDPSASITSPSLSSGPEPVYGKIVSGFKKFYHNKPFLCDHGGILPKFEIAYETWGTLNKDHSNAILLHTGLSASSHAHSHPENTAPGWWEQFIGPGKDVDTNKFFVICTNVLGSCYGSTGPSSVDPGDGKHYATRFPIITVNDMIRAQLLLLDHLKIEKLYASVGSSLGGMQSLTLGALAPHRVGRIASISGGARSHPYSIALRFTQRQILMNDPYWNRGFYYDGVPPHTGMKLAREVATISYRSGPEWEQRFGNRRADPSVSPAFCPDFLIETYLDHAGEKFCLQYDPNSLLYISKAMDMHDMSASHQRSLSENRKKNQHKLDKYLSADVSAEEIIKLNEDTSVLPDVPYQEIANEDRAPEPDPETNLIAGLAPLKDTPVMVMGVESDNLMPVECQRETARCLEKAGNKQVVYHELDANESFYGHDTFLIYRKDLDLVGGKLKKFLELS
ncbi:homoserine O-acetyltransferase [Schizosaccharomyces pombe]|uniref:Serine O-succinyltransferase n=1 Tax=Schizosaccharomyces pombe (strain 972 / ATCC 24843) TaxID=284812 RepID=SST_SCHPO|nr:putative homoserine O-acetyltransferase [Schizosaccharomyces pombe]Q10341.1 RecName: Full=Serine O-succinyltransferase; Short=SST; Flags: Precursor [Schizosaccharomyces pombe 972h-]CAB53733.1 homoserine O-acetyltransferase (predicted) [Schizosaccharomyces pombe]|eukprot:NP_595166.1 putative homoserine O-acetyltransferase [Schizosaccharomyces pombe]